ncbi:MAG: FdtA/QdtA family cupin domain-containing protein [Chloroflexi bacterium]|nr:FdtA/QdtA family cupin domain-containing protein [Chloroflexota bacterium]
MSVNNCYLIELPKVSEPRGNLTFIEETRHVPFEIKRTYYLYDVPAGAMRAGHAHKELQQFLIALSGSFDVLLDDGQEKKRYHLNRPYVGLYVCPMVWRELDNFSAGSVCLALASTFFAESDYYREYDAFLRAIKS